MILLLFIPGIPAETENQNPYDQNVITSRRDLPANVTTNRDL